MGMAELVVTAVVFEGRSKSEVARDYNLSRRWVITLVQRYLAEGEPALVPRSRRPHHSPTRTPQALEDEIIEIRKELSHAGHEAGAATTLVEPLDLAAGLGLQAQLDEFADYYNTVRPHRALGRRTPQEAYEARPKALPSGVALDDAHYRVRHDTIDANGKVSLRYGAKLHHIGIGRRHKGRHVLVLVKDRQVRITTTDGELLRDFQLDPSRDYQPQPKP